MSALQLPGHATCPARHWSLKMPNTSIPEVVKWTGGDLLGHTTAYVPTDAVAPRNRSAQQAMAFQLYDRGIIQTPAELAKIADLPDADDMLKGIDPDTARAQRENAAMAAGKPRTIDDIDDHKNHIHHHRNFVRSERYENLSMEVQQIVRMHLSAHEMYAAQQAAQQMQAAGISPLAAQLPTAATQVIGEEQVAAGAAMQGMAPVAAGQMPGAPQMPPGMGADMAPDAGIQPGNEAIAAGGGENPDEPQE